MKSLVYSMCSCGCCMKKYSCVRKWYNFEMLCGKGFKREDGVVFFEKNYTGNELCFHFCKN